MAARFSRAAATLAVLAVGMGAGILHAAENTSIGELSDRDRLRVCADPNNLPFSNQAGEGFENKIAELLADELGVETDYTWFPQSMGFVRVTLGAHRCDVVIGVATTNELMQNTNPYYRSSYALVQRADAERKATSLVDPALGELRVGAVARTPPVTVLAQHGLLDNFVPYQLVVDTRVEHPGQQMIDDVATGAIDVGIAWGPIGGYWAEQQQKPLEVTPVTYDAPGVRLDFRISMGLRRGEPEWKDTLNRFLDDQAEAIQAILLDYGVPLLDERGQPIERTALGEAGTDQPGAVAEPAGYRMDDYRAPTPATLEGATVVDAAGVERLMRERNPILIDVLPAPRKPPDWPEGKIWRQPEHQNLPGTVWLPNVGYGELSAEFAGWFESELGRLTAGDKARPLVFYCEAGCWMSWNAAKRALELGYTDVIWFPEGTTGWAAAGQFMVPAELPEMPEFVPLGRPDKAASGSCKETPCPSAGG